MPHPHLTRDEAISIHALREEGDAGAAYSATTTAYFYPRPPRGGRRFCLGHPLAPPAISIHALREEGDSTSIAATTRLGDFYPRPPRGGRPPPPPPL